MDNTTANQAKKNVSDLIIWGDGDTFKLICKASSKKEGWMKSTKAMEIPGIGCVVQVTTQQRNQTSYAPLIKNEAGEVEVETTGSGEVLGMKIDYTKEANNYVIAEAVTFVPFAKIEETKDDDGNVISRKLVAIS